MNEPRDERPGTGDEQDRVATRPAAPLPALNLGSLASLEALPGLADGAVCDIDDPDCEAPTAPAPGNAERA
jgi:hypothetical protein